MMPVLTPLPPSDVYILMLLLFLSAPRRLLPSGSALHFFLLLLSFTHSPSSSLCLALRSSSLSLSLLLSSFSTSALPSICFILISHLSSSRSVSLVIFFFFLASLQLCSFLSQHPLSRSALSSLLVSLSLLSLCPLFLLFCSCATLKKMDCRRRERKGGVRLNVFAFCVEMLFHDKGTKDARSLFCPPLPLFVGAKKI